jgi:hypothetical protein
MGPGRPRALPRPLCALGTVGLLYPLLFVLGLVLEDIDEGMWVVGIGSLVLGLPAWFLSSGVWALTAGAHENPKPDDAVTGAPRVRDPGLAREG